MKKVLALVLCALMMFTGSAMAGQMTIKNIGLYSGDELMLDLSGIDLNLAFNENGEYAGIMAGLSANGQSLVEAVAAIGAEELLLSATGLSDYYSVQFEDLMTMFEEALAAEGMTMEDLMGAMESSMSMTTEMDTAAIENLMATVEGIVMNNMSDGGTYEEQGITFQVVNMTISQEEMAQVLDGIAAVLDVYAADALEGGDYESFAALFADAGVASAMEGQILISDSIIVADFYQSLIDLNYEEEFIIEHYFLIEMLEAEEDSDEAVSISYGLYTQDDEFNNPILGVGLMLYADEMGEFRGFDAVLEVPEEEVYAYLYAYPVETEAGAQRWEINFGETSCEFDMTIGFGALTETQTCAYVDIYSGADTNIYVAYIHEGNEGQFEASMAMDGEEMAVVADVSFSEGTGAWLPTGAVESVDILSLMNMDAAAEAQMNKLAMEAQTLLMNVISGLANANPSIAALMGYAG